MPNIAGFNAASAAIDVVAQFAKPAVEIRSTSALFHLTKGFAGGGIASDAFTAAGHFNVSLGGSHSDRDWDFGFVQLARANTLGVFYAGRIAKEGGIACTGHIPPAMPVSLLLDSRDAFTPWTHDHPRFDVDTNRAEVNCPTGDHPGVIVPLQLRNSNTNVNNFLFHVIDDRDFWSVLTVIDPQGGRHSLAHFHWHLRYDFKFNWRGGTPVAAHSNSSFQVVENLKGGPTDASLQGLLNNPIPPQFNAVSQNAVKLILFGPRGPNRSENTDRFINVPFDFFQ